MQIKPLSRHVGAEIVGIDVATDLPDELFGQIEAAYDRYSVLLFRDQKLTPEQQIGFARRFGNLEISPRTEFGNVDAGRTWHTDMSYTRRRGAARCLMRARSRSRTAAHSATPWWLVCPLRTLPAPSRRGGSINLRHWCYPADRRRRDSAKIAGAWPKADPHPHSPPH